LASSKNAFDHQQTDTHGEKENENYHYHHRHPRRHTSRRKKKKKEYKATTEDGLKEKKLHDTERKRCARVTATYRFVAHCNYHNYI
jgi:hypothetical protein